VYAIPAGPVGPVYPIPAGPAEPVGPGTGKGAKNGCMIGWKQLSNDIIFYY
jgi:hypothetical protein